MSNATTGAVIAREVDEFLAARDLLLRLREDRDGAVAAFAWPRPTLFNWALDYFDPMASGNAACALCLAKSDGSSVKLSFAHMSERSTQVASWLWRQGVRRGDRMLMMLGNQVELWELMLATIKLGVVLIPATLQLTGADLHDRLSRGRVRYLVCDAATAERIEVQRAASAGGPLALPPFAGICTGAGPAGWLDLRQSAAEASSPAVLRDAGRPLATDPMLLYFTSGTTSRPKMVAHSQSSYPIGHLTTMYWLGLEPGDMHWNISSPGWAKHAWSSFFAPWNAQAAIFQLDYARFDAKQALDLFEAHPITSVCAAPTVWRLLIQEPIETRGVHLKKLSAAGEPLNPEIIARVLSAWRLPIRDGFGQTETTALIANTPGRLPAAGTMGQPLPGYRIALLDPDGRPAEEGEICVALEPRPVGLMAGYDGDDEKTASVMVDGWYHTGDVANRDESGQLTYVGRADDVFKSSGYRISPFEIESVLIEHPQVAEAAVVPTPDAIRGVSVKAFVALVGGQNPSPELAASIFAFTRERLAGYKRIKRLEFADLPKTISGKIRRAELRVAEARRDPAAELRAQEYREG